MDVHGFEAWDSIPEGFYPVYYEGWDQDACFAVFDSRALEYSYAPFFDKIIQVKDERGTVLRISIVWSAAIITGVVTADWRLQFVVRPDRKIINYLDLARTGFKIAFSAVGGSNRHPEHDPEFEFTPAHFLPALLQPPPYPISQDLLQEWRSSLERGAIPDTWQYPAALSPQENAGRLYELVLKESRRDKACIRALAHLLLQYECEPSKRRRPL